MTLNNLLETISSENKLRIIAHYFNCTCQEYDCVSDLQKMWNLNQSNLSKHLTKLKEEGVLVVENKHRKRFYSIDPEFKKEWESVLTPIINRPEIQIFQCQRCKKNSL